MKKVLWNTPAWGWSDYMNHDYMIRWIIEKSHGSTDIGLLGISESVKAYAYFTSLELRDLG